MDSITQLLDRLASLDPSGDEALLMCAIVAALLGGLIVLGFGVVHGQKSSLAKARKADEPDFVMLWRLRQSLRKGERARSRVARVDNSVKTAP